MGGGDQYQARVRSIGGGRWRFRTNDLTTKPDPIIRFKKGASTCCSCRTNAAIYCLRGDNPQYFTRQRAKRTTPVATKCHGTASELCLHLQPVSRGLPLTEASSHVQLQTTYVITAHYQLPTDYQGCTAGEVPWRSCQRSRS